MLQPRRLTWVLEILGTYRAFFCGPLSRSCKTERHGQPINRLDPFSQLTAHTAITNRHHHRCHHHYQHHHHHHHPSAMDMDLPLPPAALPQQPLFGLVPAGHAVLVTPTQTPTPSSFLYAIPASASFSHIVVFLLPGTVLPPDTAAAIYLVIPPPPPPPTQPPPPPAAAPAPAPAAAMTVADQQQPNLRFLGGIGPGKESAIFKLGGGGGGGRTAGGENVVLGVSVEAAASVAARIAQLGAGAEAGARRSDGGAQLGPAGAGASTLLLAQRIIRNAFNFLASFSGAAGPDGVEVVPLKAFEEWWRRFENKVRRDPSFLERED